MIQSHNINSVVYDTDLFGINDYEVLSESISTHNLVRGDGRYTDTLYTRIPVFELRKQSRRSGMIGLLATLELERRGVPRTTHDIDISTHAIDRASQRFIRHFLNDCAETGEGITEWLHRISKEALNQAPVQQSEISHRGMRFIFEKSGPYPLLKTVC